jgi:hypothetical protein
MIRFTMASVSTLSVERTKLGPQARTRELYSLADVDFDGENFTHGSNILVRPKMKAKFRYSPVWMFIQP